MPLPAPTTIATGFNSTAGCAYWREKNLLLLADSGTGTITGLDVQTHTKTALGTGYGYLQDIALSADGLNAYLVESNGNLLRASLSNLNRAAATVVATGFGSGHTGQIGLDEAHGYAYVTGGTSPINLYRINLSTGALSTVASGLGSTRGVLASRDGRFVYTSDDSGTITRYELATGTATVMASGLTAPRFMVWSDAGESVIVFVQGGASQMVMKLDITTPTPAVSQLAGPTAASPYSLALPSADHVLVACLQSVGEVYLTSAIYSSAGPMLLGIGFVPADATHLPGGYADTTMDPTYFYQVKDAPFGGTLPLMINHDRARSLGANFYKIQVTPAGGTAAEVTQAYSDYRWNAALSRYDLVTVAPVNGYYPLHAAGEIWLNYWLGMLLSTAGLPNGLVTIGVKLFGSQSAASEIGTVSDSGRSATLMIDNTLPTVHIDQLLHDGAALPTCALVNSGTSTLSFTITAQAQRHLGGWSLVAYWGDNASKAVASDNYSAHVSPSRLWTGLDHVTVPATPWDAAVAGDSSSTHCAHTFWLSAWDRVINGWGNVHGVVSYQKSLTLWL